MSTVHTRQPAESPILLTPASSTRLDRIKRLRQLAKILDNQFSLPGTNYRIGWDGLIGLIPGVGDIATTVLSAYIIREAHQLGAPSWLIARMIANAGVDLVAGFVPVVGDVLDLAWKANARNLRLLQSHLKDEFEMSERLHG